MRYLISGAIGLLWGGGIVLNWFFRGPRLEGSYGVAFAAAAVFGLVMFVAGIYYLNLGIRSLNSGEPRRKPRKRPRTRRGDEDGDLASL